MNTLKLIALTHKNLELQDIGKLHVEESMQPQVLGALKINFGFQEFMYLSTCNRVEFLLKTDSEINADFLYRFFVCLNDKLDNQTIQRLVKAAVVLEGDQALEHILKVAASLDSLVVGEREIITQVRKSYENCNLMGLTGDMIRLVVKQTIETAKDIYTNTDIAKNPVSVVSLAYRQLRELGIKNNARIIFVGAGETNINMAKYLQKHQYANFAIFNRTQSKAQVLANELGGKAYALSELKNYQQGFDVIVTCTGSSESIITKDIYGSLLNGDTSKKVVIDLAIPNDLDAEILKEYSIHYIDVNSLKKQATENLSKREKEIDKCNEIILNKAEEFKTLLKERRVELAFGEIPKQVKAIKETAVKEVFAKEINGLDHQSKEVLEKILSYMEKKYNAVAMKTAKELLLEEK